LMKSILHTCQPLGWFIGFIDAPDLSADLWRSSWWGCAEASRNWMWVSQYGQTQIQEVKLQQQLQLPKFPKNWSEILLWKCSMDEVPKTMNSQFTVKFKAATIDKTRKSFPSFSSQRNGNSQLGHSSKFKIGNGCHEVLKQKMNSEFFFTVTNTWRTFLTMWEPLHYVMSCLF
jgi:hypothetical protein